MPVVDLNSLCNDKCSRRKYVRGNLTSKDAMGDWVSRSARRVIPEVRNSLQENAIFKIKKK
jgi:hypothetical protein